MSVQHRHIIGQFTCAPREVKKKKFDVLILKERKNIFKNEQKSRDVAAKISANTSGVEKSNNYFDDIYIPPYKYE